MPKRDQDRKPKRRTPQSKPQPAVIRGVIVAALGFLASLGFGWAADVDRETIAAVSVLLATLLPILQGFWTRAAVVPAETTLAYVAAGGVPVAGDAATEPTGQPLPATYDGGAYVITAQPRR